MATTSAAMSTTAPLVRQPDNCPSIPSHGPLPPLPSGEEPRAHWVMQAEGRRSRGGRSVASDSGGRRDCRVVPEAPLKSADGRARRHPPPGHYEPGASKGRLGTPKVIPQGTTPRRVPKSGGRGGWKRPVR